MEVYGVGALILGMLSVSLSLSSSPIALNFSHSLGVFAVVLVLFALLLKED